MCESILLGEKGAWSKCELFFADWLGNTPPKSLLNFHNLSNAGQEELPAQVATISVLN